jgi:anti-sigma factor RsiW
MMEPMGCEQREQMTELMSMALDSLLGDDDQRRLQHHLATCPHCQVEWEAMQQASTLFEQAPMVGPPLGFAVRVERRLNERSKKRRRVFGGVAVLTSSLSLAGVTAAVAALIIFGVIAWRNASPVEMQQGTMAISQVASGMGLVGKAASLFLLDILMRYGPPLVVFVGIGLVLLTGVWAWLFIKRPGNIHRNGFV